MGKQISKWVWILERVIEYVLTRKHGKIVEGIRRKHYILWYIYRENKDNNVDFRIG